MCPCAACTHRDHAHKWLALLQHGVLLVLKGGTQHFMFQPGVCHEFRMNAEGFAAAADWGESPASPQASSSRSSLEDLEEPQEQQQQVAVTVSAADASEADPSREVIVTVTVGPPAAAAAAKATHELSSIQVQAAAAAPMQSVLGSQQPPATAASPHAKDTSAAADGNVFVHLLTLLRQGSRKQR